MAWVEGWLVKKIQGPGYPSPGRRMPVSPFAAPPHTHTHNLGAPKDARSPGPCAGLAQSRVTKQRAPPAGLPGSDRAEVEVWRPGVPPPRRMLYVAAGPHVSFSSLGPIPRSSFLLLRPKVNADVAEHGVRGHTVHVSEGECDMVVDPPRQWYHDARTTSTSWLKTTAPIGSLRRSLMLAGWSWGSLRCRGDP